MILIIILLIINTYFAFKNAERVICKAPNKFAHIFAPPGTGKTTLCASLVRKSIIENKKIYSNVPIRGAIKIDLKKMGYVEIRDATLIIDEGGAELGNRNWHKNLDENNIRFLKKHRHYNVDVYVLSQTWNDVDNKLRDLTTSLYMLKKSKIPFKIKACAIKKTMDLINGQIVQFFEWDTKNDFSFYIPKTWAYFNSYDTERNLKQMDKIIYTQIDIK